MIDVLDKNETQSLIFFVKEMYYGIYNAHKIYQSNLINIAHSQQIKLGLLFE